MSRRLRAGSRAMIAIAAMSEAGVLVAGLLGVDERMSARVVASPPHHACAIPVREER